MAKHDLLCVYYYYYNNIITREIAQTRAGLKRKIANARLRCVGETKVRYVLSSTADF